MPIEDYGVLRGRIARIERGAADDAHVRWVLEANGEEFEVPLVARSRPWPSRVLFRIDHGFRHPITTDLGRVPEGATLFGDAKRWHCCRLDYLRNRLFLRRALRALPIEDGEQASDLEADQVHLARSAVRHGAEAFAFGRVVAGGLTDLHQNQGNPDGVWHGENGPWQDGGLLLHFPHEDRWTGVFVAFSSQAEHTTDVDGHELTAQGEGPSPGRTRQGEVRIVAAVVDPLASGHGNDRVTLLSAHPEPLSLRGWKLVDRDLHVLPLDGQGPLEPGVPLQVGLGRGIGRPDGGGELMLIDPNDVRIHRVAWTGDAVQEPLGLVFLS